MHRIITLIHQLQLFKWVDALNVGSGNSNFGGNISSSGSISNSNGACMGLHLTTTVNITLQTFSTAISTYGPFTGVPANATAVLITLSGA